MSTFRKTVLTTAIIGAGLATTAGSAFATDCCHDGGHAKAKHEQSSGCSNAIAADNSGAKNTLSLLNQDQAGLGLNLCNNHILENFGNGNFSNNAL